MNLYEVTTKLHSLGRSFDDKGECSTADICYEAVKLLKEQDKQIDKEINDYNKLIVENNANVDDYNALLKDIDKLSENIT